ncbi:hypothetical protein OG563_30555 [Nocardia vinacea]|uniref:Uncharacterized protein n=1 Tax=Nocardia vinacea TaxID=96468 RepID=A0ABZ1YJY4_9NOCA|nr:hypothetical protein [Nocardia vinacea]
MSRIDGKARWGKACNMCSVPVHDDGGRLGGEPGAWTVTCGRCQHMVSLIGVHGHTDRPLPDVQINKPPRGAAARIWLRAFGLARVCTQCGIESACVAGLFPVFPAEEFHLLLLVDTESSWKLVKHLLERSGVADGLARTIIRRADPIGAHTALTGGCMNCGSAFDTPGADPEVQQDLARRGRYALSSIASAECSVVKWHRALYDPARTFVRA